MTKKIINPLSSDLIVKKKKKTKYNYDKYFFYSFNIILIAQSNKKLDLFTIRKKTFLKRSLIVIKADIVNIIFEDKDFKTVLI